MLPVKKTVPWLALLAAGGICLGCFNSNVRQPQALLQSSTPVARGQMPDIENGPTLRIAGPPQTASGPAQGTEAPRSPALGAGLPTPLAPDANFASLRTLYRLAAERYASIDAYVARLRRREQVNGKDGPEELLQFKWRKQPWSVYFRWLGTVGKGREVLYVRGQHDDLIHTLLAAGDMPLVPAGKQMALAVDNFFVRAASRHPITEAGIGNSIDRFGTVLAAMERGQTRQGTMRYLGQMRRPEFARPMDAVEHVIPAGAEAALPRGGRRWILFDQQSRLPVLVITHDDRGHEVEYYCYDQLQFPVRLTDADFDPARLWDR
jgi:hypothetical protein